MHLSAKNFLKHESLSKLILIVRGFLSFVCLGFFGGRGCVFFGIFFLKKNDYQNEIYNCGKKTCYCHFLKCMFRKTILQYKCCETVPSFIFC